MNWLSRLNILRNFFKRNGISAGFFILFSLFILFVFVPLVFKIDSQSQNFEYLLSPPSSHHIFGTDQLGRDIFARILAGGKVSASLGLAVVALSSSLGTVIGIISGFAGGKIDRVVMHITNLFMSIPKLILAMAISFSLGVSLINLVIAVTAVHWPEFCRLSRSVTMVSKERNYVVAARNLGVSRFKIMRTHIFPDVFPHILTRSSIDVGLAITYVSGLSFIGLGVKSPSSELGLMVSDGRSYILDAWWVSFFPGFFLCLLSLGFILIGEGLKITYLKRN